MVLSFVSRILLYWNTIKYLKKVQIFYQVKYRCRKYWHHLIRFKYALSQPSSSKSIHLIPWIEKQKSYSGCQFIFLNQGADCKKEWENGVDWNEMRFGKLWAYNLNYMDYLVQPGLDTFEGNKLIENFISGLQDNYIGLEPYVISIRGINWIKYFSERKIQNAFYDNSLYAQYRVLIDNLEYHILGNHLLENGFSLLFGSFYFNDRVFFEKAERILTLELNEQILSDGGHFELSTMYHRIVLERLLDSINLMHHNQRFTRQENLLSIMQKKAVKMIYWINSMTFSNGLIPLFNDSSNNIAASINDLNKYAESLNLVSETDLIKNQLQNSLSESGYRRFDTSSYECIIDVGPIGPEYQPGHAHADTFNFCLCVHNEPFIIDPGVSTYENNTIRHNQRSTSMHNTVSIQNKNSSDVWSSFRVGKRAEATILDESKNYIHAIHNGYGNITHSRKWAFKEEKIEIEDILNGNINEGSANFIFHPGVKPQVRSNSLYTGNAIIEFKNSTDIKLIQIKIPDGFNKLCDTMKAEVSFSAKLKTVFQFKPMTY